MEEPEPDAYAELRKFLTTLRSELDEALREHEEWFGDLHEQFRAAWSELQAQHHFEEAVAALNPARMSEEDLRRRGLTEEDLRRRGLTGQQLALKMALFNSARERFHKADARGGRMRGLRNRARRRFPRAASFLASLSSSIRGLAGPAHWFGAFLDVADKILESLIDVLPGGEAIKEFKDAVKAVVSAV